MRTLRIHLRQPRLLRDAPEAEWMAVWHAFLAEVQRNCPDIQEVDLEPTRAWYTDSTTLACKAIGRILPTLQSMERLRLGNGILTESTNLLRSASKCSSLDTLRVELSNPLPEWQLVPVLRGCQAFRHLRELHIIASTEMIIAVLGNISATLEKVTLTVVMFDQDGQQADPRQLCSLFEGVALFQPTLTTLDVELSDGEYLGHFEGVSPEYSPQSVDFDCLWPNICHRELEVFRLWVSCKLKINFGDPQLRALGESFPKLRRLMTWQWHRLGENRMFDATPVTPTALQSLVQLCTGLEQILIGLIDWPFKEPIDLRSPACLGRSWLKAHLLGYDDNGFALLFNAVDNKLYGMSAFELGLSTPDRRRWVPDSVLEQIFASDNGRRSETGILSNVTEYDGEVGDLLEELIRVEVKRLQAVELRRYGVPLVRGQ